MYDCEGYGGEFVFVYYELPKLEPLEYNGYAVKSNGALPEHSVYAIKLTFD